MTTIDDVTLRVIDALNASGVDYMLVGQRGKLDWPHIERWCREHGTLARLEAIRQTVPEI